MHHVVRRMQYENEIALMTIGGEEHLKYIQLNSEPYEQKCSDLRGRITGDIYLLPQDREILLKKLSMNEIRKEDSWLNYLLVFISGFGVGYMMKGAQDDQSEKFYEEVFEAARKKLSELLE